MTITFLIGNGFDKGLGLPTSYKEFYPYFLENVQKDNLFYEILKKEEKRNYENWADLEIALGEFTQDVKPDEYVKFAYDKVEMDNLLGKYLTEVSGNFTIEEKEARKKIEKLVYYLKNSKIEKERQLISNSFKPYENQDYVYEAITYNYTKCFDSIFEMVKKSGVLATRTYKGSKYNEFVGSSFHIHGTLTDNEMILGVNDENQIVNPDMRKNMFVRRALIKPELNTQIGQNKIEKAKNLLDRSSIIVTYGMSLGDTDKMWWEYIGDLLQKDSSRLLVVFNYQENYVEQHSFMRLVHRDDICNRFFSKAGIKEKNIQERIKGQIVIYDNLTI